MQVKVKKLGRIRGIYWTNISSDVKYPATENLTPGISVYGERLIDYKEIEYRVWDPYRSKLAAYIIGCKSAIPIKEKGTLLYLGAGSGTTVSHISDILQNDGKIFCVEFAQRVLRKLIDTLCQRRRNLYPVFADARFPEKYPSFVTETEGIYCDIAQAEQAKILANNASCYLKKGGWVLLAIKARSIDVTSDPQIVIKREVKILESQGFDIQDVRRLEPFQRDHAMVYAIFQ